MVEFSEGYKEAAKRAVKEIDGKLKGKGASFAKGLSSLSKAKVEQP